MFSVEFGAIVTAPATPIVSSPIVKAIALVISTVTLTPAAMKTSSEFVGKIAVFQMLVSDQFPLLVAVTNAAWPTEAKSRVDRIVKAAKICFIFMVSFGGVGLVEIIYLCLESSSKAFNCDVYCEYVLEYFELLINGSRIKR